ncbi:hypothetical protein IP87_08755 [beta proteobacterium AAP121]|nr:hypothetical protein IP80_01035 [beta proteobacterium AAP65]KPF98248.1 hypothetical protein IP87_08755 [beta proteobacterium AAP121]
MDLARPELADRLAGAYVLGTLRGPARRRFDVLLLAHPALQGAVRAWQARLLPLTQSLAPVAAPPRVWAGVEARLFEAPVRAPLRWWRALGLWRGLSAFASTAAVALLVVMLEEPPPLAPTVVVLAAQPVAAQGGPALFVASLSPDGRALVLQPLQAPALTAAQALELWAVPRQGGPRSLGVVRADRATTLLLPASAQQGTAAFAVSVEPAGGSPTGAPTGPVVSLGSV